MSFRIEDILKKEPKSNNLARSVSVDDGSSIIDNRVRNSILQQTLMSRSHHHHQQYGRSISEEYSRSTVLDSYHQLPHFDHYQQNNNKNAKVSSCGATNMLQSYRNRSSWPTTYPSYVTSYHQPVAAMFFPHYVHYSKRKGGQVRFSANQTEALEKRFVAHKYLSPEDRRILADSLKLSDKQVKTWFQNRRAKSKRSNSSLNGSEDRLDSSESDEKCE